MTVVELKPNPKSGEIEIRRPFNPEKIKVRTTNIVVSSSFREYDTGSVARAHARNME